MDVPPYSASPAEPVPAAVPPPIAAPATRALSIGVIVLMLVLLLLATAELPLYVHNPAVPGWQVAVIGLSQVLVVGGWLLIDLRSRRYAALPLDRPLRWMLHHMRRVPLLIAGFIVCTYGLRHVAYALAGATYHYYWPIVLVYESCKVVLLLSCWLALIFGMYSFLRMQTQTERLLRIERSLAQAQLSQLKAQLHPHFLFNALNTISSFMHADARRADRLLAQLGDLLRISLANSERTLVLLSEELELLHRYADIMQARFGERVQVQWEIGADAGDVLVPAMLLQPLLENAFKHGVEYEIEPQRIYIRAHCDAERLHVVIHNTRSTLVSTGGRGLGLSNCRERLQLLYGDGADVQLRSDGNEGVEVAVTLPATRNAH